jgi:glycosyltransferase involved in cell wall biosynthesis
MRWIRAAGLTPNLNEPPRRGRHEMKAASQRHDVMTIAAVITTYNSGAFLEEALASVLAQTRPPEEIIIIDDGSTDDTPERMRRWAKRVAYHRQANAGSSVARNNGWRLAGASWIAYLDADDLWLPDRLERQEAWVRDHPETEAVFGLAQNFVHPGCETMFDPERSRLDQWQPGWLPSAVLIRRSVLERGGGFDAGLRNAEAIDWLIRQREAGVVLAMPEIPVVRRRLHGSNKGRDEKPGLKPDLQILRKFIARKRARQSGPS